MTRTTSYSGSGEGFGLYRGAGGGGNDRHGRSRGAEEGDVVDLLAVDCVVERLLHLQVEELAVGLLLGVRVDDEVRLVEARHIRDFEARVA